MRAGFVRILADGCGAILVMDGDDQHDISDISKLIKKMDETSAVGSAVTVEHPAYVTGVFGMEVNVGAGEAVGIAAGVEGAQEVSRKKVKERKINGKSFLSCISAPFLDVIVPPFSSIRQMKSSTRCG